MGDSILWRTSAQPDGADGVVIVMDGSSYRVLVYDEPASERPDDIFYERSFEAATARCQLAYGVPPESWR